MNWEGLAKDLCKRLGFPVVTQKYIPREDIKSAVIYNNVKTVKDKMALMKKLSLIKYSDCREMADYMKEKSLEDSRLEFLWLTDRLDSRTTTSIAASTVHTVWLARSWVWLSPPSTG